MLLNCTIIIYKGGCDEGYVSHIFDISYQDQNTLLTDSSSASKLV